MCSQHKISDVFQKKRPGDKPSGTPCIHNKITNKLTRVWKIMGSKKNIVFGKNRNFFFEDAALVGLLGRGNFSSAAS